MSPPRASLLLALVWLASAPVSARADDYYVAPDGSAAGEGTESRPWDLSTALSGGEGRPGPGDTVWLAPGEYHGHAEVRTAGTAEAPLHIRGAGADQTALVVDAGHNPLELDFFPNHVAHHVWVWDLEIRSSVGNRFDPEPGAPYDVEMGGGMAASYAEGLHLINLVIHDTGQAVSLYNQSHDAVVYGCVIFNNGFLSPARGHGHGIYTHNNDASRVTEIANNIVLPQVGLLVQAYSTNGSIRGYAMHGNTIVDGSVILGGTSRAPVEAFELTGNFGYELRVALGYQGGFAQNVSMVASDNYIHGHFEVSSSWQSLRLEGNTFVAAAAPFDRMVVNARGDGGSRDGWSVGGNTYWSDDDVRWIDHAGFFYSLDDMRSMGLEQDSVRREGTPPNEIFVQANRYDEDRAHLIVYNYEERDEVPVDLSALGWSPGDVVRVRNARAYYADHTEHNVTPDGIEVAMTGRMPQPVPIGLTEPTGYRGVDFFPRFGVFVVERIARAEPTTDAGPIDADAGLAPDAGASDPARDAGALPAPPDGGCACRSAARGTSGSMPSVALLAGLAWWLRRRQTGARARRG